MARLSVTERKPPGRKKGDNLTRDDRDGRKKRYDQAKDIVKDRPERAYRVFPAIRVTLANASEGVVGGTCPKCQHVGWKWQTKCSRCGTPLA